MTEDSRFTHGESTRDLVGRSLLEAIALEGNEREAFLDRLGADSPELALEVRDLLPWFAQAVAVQPAPEPEAGDLVGGCRLVEELGEGGFGRVWRARPQAEGLPDVAIKLVKAGTDTAAVLRRFRRERNVLGRLTHSGIAAIQDAGRTEGGRPFIVMELIDGPRITEHVDRAALGRTETLVLFERVCRAVEYAHSQGILHRDLKPSNVLVVEEGAEALPKVIDFGIAAVLASEGNENVTRTEDGRRIGSLGYMSPEQAGLLDAPVDARTDVFALGRLLHQLLVGEPAVASRSGESPIGFSDLQPIFDRGAPSPLAAARKGEGRQVERALDAIVRKASATEPDRRYSSVRELREDVRRFLDHKPVEATAPGLINRGAHFVRRHRAVLIPSTVLVLGLSIAVVTSLKAQARTVEANERLGNTLEFQTALIDRLEPATLAPALLREITGQFVARLDDPGERAAILRAVTDELDTVALAQVALSRGVLEPVEQQLESKLDEWREENNDLALAVIDLRRRFGLGAGRAEFAGKVQAAVQRSSGAGSMEDLTILLTLGNVALRTGDLGGARAHFSALQANSAGGSPDLLYAAEHGLALVLHGEGRFAEAIASFEELLDAVAARGLAGTESEARGWLSLAVSQEAVSDSANALASYERARSIVVENGLEQAFPGRAYEVALARLRAVLGDSAGTTELLEEIAIELERTLGRNSERTAIAYSSLASARYAAGELAGALEASERASECFESIHTARHPNALALRRGQVEILNLLERPEEALALCEKSLALARIAVAPEHQVVGGLMLSRAGAFGAMERIDEAVVALEEALKHYESVHDANDPRLATPFAIAADFYAQAAALRPDQGFEERADRLNRRAAELAD